jgi:putative hemolysin
MAYILKENKTGRELPTKASGGALMQVRKYGYGESVEFCTLPNGEFGAELWRMNDIGKYYIAAIWEYDCNANCEDYG